MNNKINIFKTGLYPTNRALEEPTLFYAKSNCIKAYPASWRNVELYKNDESDDSTTNKIFDVEAVLNTEYNITRKAGALKHFLDDKDTDGRGTYTFKFFLNGYSFEVNNLDLCAKDFDDADANIADKRAALDLAKVSGEASEVAAAEADLAEAEAARKNVGKVDLYVGIRTLAQQIGSSELDFTQVLVPYGDTTIDAPTYLDRKIANLFETTEANTSSGYNDSTNTPIGPLANADDPRLAYVYANEENFVFTGLVFSKTPIIDPPDVSAENNFYSIQILKDGDFCTDLMWPNIKAGQALDQSSVLLGQTVEHSLVAPDYGMVAMGQYNATLPEEDPNKLLVAVGIGNNNDQRRNAFAISGDASDTPNTDGKYTFDSSISSGPFNIHYSSDLESQDKETEVSGIYTLNRGIEVAKDGSKIVINRPITDTNGIEKVVSNTEIGVHSYGNINILGCGLYFKDSVYAGENDRTIATMEVKDMANGTVISDRGLHMTGIADINNGAVGFRPGSVIGSFTLSSLNNQGITISATADDLVFKNQNNLRLQNAVLSNIKQIINPSGFNINDLKFSDSTITNLQTVKSSAGLSIHTSNAINIKDSSNNVRCIINGTGFTGNSDYATYPQVIQFVEKNSLKTRGPSGTEVWGVQGIYRNAGTANNNPESSNSAYIKLNACENADTTEKAVEINGTTTLTGDLEVTGSVNFGSMVLGNVSNNSLYKSIIDAVYPVGSIYMTMTDGMPFPGSNTKWKRIAHGEMLMGAFDEDNVAPTGYLNTLGTDSSEIEGGSYHAALPPHTHTTRELTGLFGSTYELIKAKANVVDISNRPSSNVDYYFPAAAFTWLDREENIKYQIDYLGYNYTDRQIEGLSGWAITDRNGNINPGAPYRLDDEEVNASAKSIKTTNEGSHSHTITCAGDGNHKHTVRSPYQDNWGEGSYTGCEPNAGGDSAGGWLNCDVGWSSTHTHKMSETTAGAHDHTINTKHLHRTIVDFTDKSTDSASVKNDISVQDFANLPPFLTCYIWQRTE